jgi:D-tyrosyl-tRNA(Tyr) deacylase
MAILLWLVNLHFKPLQKNRPSYIKAAKPDVAIPLYESFVQQLKKELEKKIHTGVLEQI